MINTANTFKVGDEVKVIASINGHKFKIGEYITIDEVNQEDYRCTNGKDFWWLTDQELEGGVMDGHWLTLINAESEKGWWDLFHNPEEKSIRLVRFDSSKRMGEFAEMTYAEWEDLVALVHRITADKRTASQQTPNSSTTA